MRHDISMWATSCVLGVGLCAWAVGAQSSGTQQATPGAQSVASSGAAAGSAATTNGSGAGSGATMPKADAHGTANDDKAHGDDAAASAKAENGKSAGASPAPVPPLVAALSNAKDLYRGGKLQESLDAYNAVLKNDPDIPMAYVGIARVDLKLKKPAEAYTAASKALEMSPTLAAAHVAMGEVYFRQGQLDDADREFRGIVKTGAADARAYLGLARLYFANANRRHAVILLDRAHEIDPSDPDIQRQWIYTLSRKDRIAELKKFLDVDKDVDDEHSYMAANLKEMEDEEEQGRACHAVGKVENAEIPLEPVEREDPRYPQGVGLRVHMGNASAKLELDTGAHGILVDRIVADKAGIKHVVDTDTWGIGDQKKMNGYMGVASSIKVGNLEFVNCEVFVADRRSIIGDDGLIGADVFQRYLVDINIPQRKMMLDELPPEPPLAADDVALTAQGPFANAARLRDRYIAPEMKDYTEVYTFGHDFTHSRAD